MKKTISLLLIGVGCFGISALIGSSIGPDGVLIEKGFMFIPLGYLFIFSAVILFAYQTIRQRKRG